MIVYSIYWRTTIFASIIFHFLKYMAGHMDTTTIEVDKFHPSSQLCSNCGEKIPKRKI